MEFLPQAGSAPSEKGHAYWVIFNNEKVMVELGNDVVTLPFAEHPLAPGVEVIRKRYLGQLNGHPCYAAEITNPGLLPQDMALVGLRRLFFIDESLFRLAGRAFQVINWDRTHQYCGQCGAQTLSKADELARVCTRCGLTGYPRISPAVMVGVVKGNQLLLAYSRFFRSRFYSVLSGFVEPGETLEECLHREVREEVGLEIKNPRYFGSQSWPFPHSLMIAFTAEYAGGEITVNGEEILDAQWFKPDRLPAEIPGPISIARRLIDWFVKEARE